MQTLTYTKNGILVLENVMEFEDYKESVLDELERGLTSYSDLVDSEVLHGCIQGMLKALEAENTNSVLSFVRDLKGQVEMGVDDNAQERLLKAKNNPLFDTNEADIRSEQ